MNPADAAAVGRTMRFENGTIIAGFLLALLLDMQPAMAEPAASDVYREHCAVCHGAQLEGSGGPASGPALKGPAFLSHWSRKPPEQLLSYIQKAMPLTAPGSLDPADARAAANVVLVANHLPLASKATAASDRSAFERNIDAGKEDRDATYQASMRARTDLLRHLRPVRDASLAAPSDADWLAWRGTAATHGFSMLNQISTANVGSLALAWSLSLDPGTNAIAPIVHDGVLFMHSSGKVLALDARNGDLLWQYARAEKAMRAPSDQPRGIALYGEALYVPTVDNHVLALDAKTGKLLWDHEIAPPADMLQLTAAPLAVRGKIIQGVSGCSGQEAGGGCYIVALDAKTGREVWRFHTIAQPGQPGDDSWNGAPWRARHGGSVWVTGSYDPALNLVYFGTGQTYAISTLLDPQARKGASTDALFTDTTLALNPDTGKLVWYYQHAAGDVWDHDWAFERTIASLDRRPQKIVLTGGKIGIFDALDAKTGAYLWSFDLGLQNIVTAIDPKTGRKTFNKALTPQFGRSVFVCPSSLGNRNWASTAYDPRTRILYIPVVPTCMDFSRSKPGGAITLENYGEMVVHFRRRPGEDGREGWLAALDIAHRKILWTDKWRAPLVSGALATAGGLVFEAGRDRVLRAVGSRSGATLWHARLPSLPNSFPLTYSVDGTQYIAIVVGGATVLDSYESSLTPEEAPVGDAKTIMVFALPSRFATRN